VTSTGSGEGAEEQAHRDRAGGEQDDDGGEQAEPHLQGGELEGR